MTDIVADIGGTHARFSQVRAGQLEKQTQLHCADFEHFTDALKHIITLFCPESPPRRLCLAVAGTVEKDHIALSNNHWHFSKTAVKKEFGLDALTVINDFTAQALGVSCLNMTNVDTEYYRILRPGIADTNTPIAVLGPGTGLGFSALIPAKDYMIPLETEGGQIGLAAQSPEEEQLLKNLRAQLRHDRLVAEDVLSGRGLVNIYTIISNGLHNIEEAAHVTARAEQGHPDAQQSIAHFFNFLGSYIASSILAIGARQGVFICGGITPKLLPFLSHSAFFDRISNHDKFSDFITSVPIYVVEDDFSGLRGAAVALDNPGLEHRRI